LEKALSATDFSRHSLHKDDCLEEKSKEKRSIITNQKQMLIEITFKPFLRLKKKRGPN